MSINTTNGILDITGAIVRVSKMEFKQATGFDTVFNNIARNTILLSDSATYSTHSTYHNWALKLPNAWILEADVYLASGTAGGGDHTFQLNFYNNVNTAITNGYTLGLDGNSLTLKYDGTQISTATLSTTLNDDVWHKLFVLFERDTFAVAIDGKGEYTFTDSTLRDRVYNDDAGYVVFYHEAGVDRQIKNVKFVNGDKWIRESGSSNIAYIGGSVGIGTDAPKHTLDVLGNANVGTLTVTSVSGDGSGLSLIQSSNVSDFASNVARIATLETADMTIDGEKTFSSNLKVGTANLFVDTTTGRVGIGTTTPTCELDVTGEAKVSGNVAVNANTLFVDSANSRVGVGVASPAQTLEVAGTMRFSNVSNSSVFSDMYALPVTVGEYWDAGLKLVASNPGDTDYFARGISISSDGNTAIVGAYGNNNQGSAYIFVRNGSTWTQQDILVHPNPADNDQFGYSVAISSNGNTAIVGARYDDDTADNSGSAYVFTRSNGGWGDGVILVASDAAVSDNFGISVSISGDGNTAIVGANGDNTSAGSAYIFTWNGSQWIQDAKLVHPFPVAQDQFGFSVSISSDGNTAIVGAFHDEVTATDQGSAYVFTRTNGGWGDGVELVASDEAAGDYFGVSVAISSNGNTAIVGARNDDDTATDQGSAYVFTRSNEGWDTGLKLVASDAAASDYLGRDVAISSDGNTVIVGAWFDDVTKADQGSAYVFKKIGSSWIQTKKIVAPEPGVFDNFGSGISISGDGTTALIGAFKDDVTKTDQGSAYIFNLAPPSNVNALSISSSVGIGTAPRTQLEVAGTIRISNVSNSIIFSDMYPFTTVDTTASFTQQAKITADDSLQGNQFGRAIAISNDGNTAIIGAQYDDDINGTLDIGTAYIFKRTNGIWSKQNKLTATDKAQNDQFGNFVSMSDDGNTVVVGAYIKDVSGQANAGGAYIYAWNGSTWQETIITAFDPQADDQFGASVSISGDGTTIFIGANGEDRGLTDTGSVYVWRGSGTSWTYVTRLNASDGATNNYFGTEISLSRDGSTAIIGSPYHAVGGVTNSGAAYIFEWNGSGWSQQTKLTGVIPTDGDLFGRCVGISGDGNTVIVSAPYNDQIVGNGGSVYVFSRYKDSIWYQQANLTISDLAASDLMGLGTASCVALTYDGNVAIVGVSYQNVVGNNSGSAYVFKRTGGNWYFGNKLLPPDGDVLDYFGNSVAISGDGSTAMVGARLDDEGGLDNTGSVYIFTHPSTVNTLQVSTPISANGTLLSFTGQHMCFPDGPMSQGLVVSANKNKYMNLNGPLTTGLGAIKSSESLPVVTLSNVTNDRSLFGVVDRLEYGGTVRNQTTGITIVNATKELGDNRVIVNSIGEGAMWVANTNGNLVSGDYITTSNIAGYGQKQDSEFLANYTVAKITMDCDFNPADLPVQVIKKNSSGKNVLDAYGRLQWEDTDRTQKAYSIRYLTTDGTRTDQANAVWTAAYVGCTYHCG